MRTCSQTCGVPERKRAARLLNLEDHGSGEWQESDAVVRCDNLSTQRPCICLGPLKGVTMISGLVADTPLF